jgi:hypothetical protein
MGFIDDKNNVFQQIAVFETLGNLPENRITSSFDSVTSKSKNLLPFILDLLTVLCKDDSKPRNTSVPKFGSTAIFPPGTQQKQEVSPRSRVKCELTRILIEILVDFWPVLIKILKEGIVKALKAGLLCPTDFQIPNPPVTLSIELPNIDLSNLMKVDPNIFPGNLLFGDPETDLNLFLSNLIQNGTNSATPVTGSWKNLLDFNFDPNTENIDIAINSAYNNQPFDNFLFDFINSIELIDFKNLLPQLMNQLFGSIDVSLPNFDSESSVSKEKVDGMVDKVLNSDPCQEDFIFDNSFFEFNSDELLDIEKRSNDRKSGQLTVDAGCSPFSSTISTQTLKNLSDDLDNASPSEYKSIVAQYTDTMLDEMQPFQSGSAEANQQKKAFSVKIATSIPKLFTDVVFTPKITILYQLAQNLITNTITDVGVSVNVDDTLKSAKFDFAKANKVFFEFVVRESMAALLEILVNQIKEEVIKLVISLTTKLIKEAADKRIKQLLSLVGGSAITAGIASIPTPDVSDFV